jgi:hypothetical protein
MTLSSLEHDAIVAGADAGERALEEFRRYAVLKLFVRDRQSARAEPRLEALRDYAELRRALLSEDRIVPASSLLAAGFTLEQIVQCDAIITGRAEG